VHEEIDSICSFPLSLFRGISSTKELKKILGELAMRILAGSRMYPIRYYPVSNWIIGLESPFAKGRWCREIAGSWILST